MTLSAQLNLVAVPLLLIVLTTSFIFLFIYLWNKFRLEKYWVDHFFLSFACFYFFISLIDLLLRNGAYQFFIFFLLVPASYPLGIIPMLLENHGLRADHPGVIIVATGCFQWFLVAFLFRKVRLKWFWFIPFYLWLLCLLADFLLIVLDIFKIR